MARKNKRNNAGVWDVEVSSTFTRLMGEKGITDRDFEDKCLLPIYEILFKYEPTLPKEIVEKYALSSANQKIIVRECKGMFCHLEALFNEKSKADPT